MNWGEAMKHISVSATYTEAIVKGADVSYRMANSIKVSYIDKVGQFLWISSFLDIDAFFQKVYLDVVIC